MAMWLKSTAIRTIRLTICVMSMMRWKEYHMANTDKWYFAYTIDGDTITIIDERSVVKKVGLERVVETPLQRWKPGLRGRPLKKEF